MPTYPEATRLNLDHSIPTGDDDADTVLREHGLIT